MKEGKALPSGASLSDVEQAETSGERQWGKGGWECSGQEGSHLLFLPSDRVCRKQGTGRTFGQCHIT